MDDGIGCEIVDERVEPHGCHLQANSYPSDCCDDDFDQTQYWEDFLNAWGPPAIPTDAETGQVLSNGRLNVVTSAADDHAEEHGDDQWEEIMMQYDMNAQEGWRDVPRSNVRDFEARGCNRVGEEHFAPTAP